MANEENGERPGDLAVESRLKKIFDSSRNFLASALSEWLPSLIDQPTNPPFVKKAIFNDEIARIARLIVMAVLLSVIIIGSFKLVYNNISESAAIISQTILDVIKLSLCVIIAVFLVSLVYFPIAALSGVKISQNKKLSLRQVFFTTLYIIVPWLPIFAFIITAILPSKGIILLLLLMAPYLCLIYIMLNFMRAIKVITDCNWTPVILSVLAPFFMLGVIFLILLLS